MSINKSHLVLYAMGALVFVLLSDVPSDYPLLFRSAQAAIGVAFVACFFLPVRKALILLLLLCIAGRDIETTGSADVLFQSASIWQLYLGPLRPSWLVFACVAAQLIKVRRTVIDPEVYHAILWFAIVPFVTAYMYGFLGTDPGVVNFLTDLKLPLILLLTIVVFRSVINERPEWLLAGFTALLAAAFSRHAVDLIYFFLDIGPRLGEANRVSLDSAKGLVVFLMLYSVYLVQFGRQRIAGMSMGVGATLLVTAYATRLLYLTGMLGGLVLAPLYGAKRSLQIFVLFALLGVTGVWTLSVLRPDMASVALGRISSMTVSRRYNVAVDRNVFSAMDPSRYAEAVNVLDDLVRRGSFMWGNGYGSYYSDRAVPFPDEMYDSFPPEWYHLGQFYRAHNYFLHFFLKYGLLGLIVLSRLWLAPAARMFWKSHRASLLSGEDAALALGCAAPLAAFSITSMLQMYWSGKGLLINGLVIAIVSACAARQSQQARLQQAVPRPKLPRSIAGPRPHYQPQPQGSPLSRQPEVS